ncbi:CynX/NimT family MFS transporter [Pseudomonas syringae]|uniref:MFS transporter n=1 Tax=Pseudomonas syringae TaxID=317 RepID=UPI001F0E7F3F|nr:MFS transporter [Pseudomonas syringae]MCH5487756.1 MFS transporter [Pseudomonas syringae pv. syringae]MDO1458899.1 MFS transporter [Pseudomonas syringae pv. syringae]
MNSTNAMGDKNFLSSTLVLGAGVSAAMHVGKLPPAVPALQESLLVTLMQAGFLLSLVQIGTMLLGLGAGLAAEYIGLRRCMLQGLWLLSAASICGALVQSADMLMLLRAVEGGGMLMATIAGPGLLRRVAPPGQSVRVLGLWSAYMPLGAAMALLLGPFVINGLGWRGWWWFTALVSAAFAVAVYLQVPVERASERKRPTPERRAWIALLQQTLKSKGVWLGSLSFTMYSAQWLAVIGFLPALYAEAGWSGPMVAVLTATVAAVNIIGAVVAGLLLQRGLRPDVLLSIGFGAMAVGAWLAFSDATTGSPILRYVGALLFSSVGGLIPGNLFALAPQLSPGERSISTYVGLLLQFAAVGQVAGPPMVAWLATEVGGWQWTWVLTCTFCVAGAVLARYIHLWISTPAHASQM